MGVSCRLATIRVLRPPLPSAAAQPQRTPVAALRPKPPAGIALIENQRDPVLTGTHHDGTLEALPNSSKSPTELDRIWYVAGIRVVHKGHMPIGPGQEG